MSKRLENKVALITGASSGLGLAIALAFVKEGAIVIGTDVNESESSMNFSWFLTLDVTKSEQWKNTVAETVKKYGRIDILVNNAGVGRIGDPEPVWNTPEDAFEIVQSINAKGVFLGCKYASAQMIKQEPNASGDRGSILNIASIYGQVAGQNIISYVASKHACIGITKAAALDCAPYRVHVNAICPGHIETAMTKRNFEKNSARLQELHPFKGTGEPDDIARAAIFLASDDNSWMTGSLMTVDGGYVAR